ncbi:hypothetical protein DKX38_013600 [Salix brachista]|uniref:DUF4283 domain-containing protein n=1 Tax=Salix brachista TaxID=2182728 RepID=A0A5N5LF35_9ROSI|nr:hypothetical protein DKX38_013600 [Salix brachista]
MATSRSTQVQQQQPRTWADKVRVSNSSSRCKLDKLPRQLAGTVLNIPKDIVHGLQKVMVMANDFMVFQFKSEEAIEEGRRMEYARVCVEIEVDTPLVHHFPMDSSLTEQPLMVEVTYEWKPARCASCKVFGHSCKPKEDLGKGKEDQREADRGQEQEVPTPLGNPTKEVKESRHSEPVNSNKDPITTQPSAHINDKAEGTNKLDKAQTGLRCKEKAKGIMEDQMGLGIESMMDSGHTSEGGAEAEASGCSTSAGTSIKNNGSSTPSPKATKKKKGAKKRRATQSLS